MINAVLPEKVASATTRDTTRLLYLLPDEAIGQERWVDRRVREFALGRTCARMALSQLGYSEFAVRRSPTREPVWPDQVVGSITHCESFVAAAAAYRCDFAGVGIDAEPHAALPKGVVNEVITERERCWIESGPPGVHWDRVIFCAKECTYKVWFPLTRKWLGFDDVCVQLHPETATFSVIAGEDDLEFSNLLRALVGRFHIEDGIVVASAVISALS